MIDKQEYERNTAAYRQQKEFIRQHYPRGRFVALARGEIVADAASFEELYSTILAMGTDPLKAFAVQAGIDYPEHVDILAQDLRP